jgi:enterochelin esterase family protein
MFDAAGVDAAVRELRVSFSLDAVMKNQPVSLIVAALALILTATACKPAAAQATRPAPVVSPEVSSDRRVTFRLNAPKATAVRLEGSDFPNFNFGANMTKGADGVWTHTLGPVPAGAYRYNFNVDQVRTLDPVNPSTSEANANTWSLVVVPGSEVFDTRDVPHGAVAQVTYYSKSLNKSRRMHIYTPPGYERGKEKLPVLYLLHGAFDCDDSWTTVGRAGFILDNLIAAGKATPMIVVMPTGHTGLFSFGAPGAIDQQVSDFVRDFTGDIRPFVEANYRVRTDRAGRAVAGLSMGGAQTIEIASKQLKDFGYLGVFSSGVFGIPLPGAPKPTAPTWEDRNKAWLDDPSLKKGLSLVWFATGKEDFLLAVSRETVAAFRRHGFKTDFYETEGGHTWLNWRDYLSRFTPLLFKRS